MGNSIVNQRKNDIKVCIQFVGLVTSKLWRSQKKERKSIRETSIIRPEVSKKLGKKKDKDILWRDDQISAGRCQMYKKLFPLDFRRWRSSRLLSNSESPFLLQFSKVFGLLCPADCIFCSAGCYNRERTSHKSQHVRRQPHLKSQPRPFCEAARLRGCSLYGDIFICSSPFLSAPT